MTQLTYPCAKCASLYQMSQKNEPLFVKYFLGDCKLKIIETQYFKVHFYIISINLVANYVSIAKLKKMFLKI